MEEPETSAAGEERDMETRRVGNGPRELKGEPQRLKARRPRGPFDTRAHATEAAVDEGRNALPAVISKAASIPADGPTSSSRLIGFLHYLPRPTHHNV